MRVSHLAAADELLLLGGVGVRGREVLSVMTTSRRAGLEAVIEPAASREAVSSGRRAVQSDGSAESPATHRVRHCAPQRDHSHASRKEEQIQPNVCARRKWSMRTRQWIMSLRAAACDILWLAKRQALCGVRGALA